ncbi:response regulator [Spirochaeta isovalerica]|uniref:DNA-binding NarL/FixJ family response regulator n=1 Tax=Spirochaeta isovalerica TaxID=150 RepID=A0A841R9T8_9SPIO|nr:response regulator [Spirochaeta isovalerica]MBB6480663.1 DNA-binding NarL/FixJ family response regulator [Spirochaeta isovalerica]
MDTILVVDESSLFRKFAKYMFETQGFVVHTARSGFDGLNQLRKHRPDLVIIDDGLNRQSVNNLLKKKGEDINISETPVIFTAREFTQERIVELCRVKVRRFLVKPLKIDQFFETVDSFLSHSINVDSTSCQLNLHVNQNIILVEVAMGLNSTKLDLVYWKIREIIESNDISDPRIMILMSDVHMEKQSEFVLERFIKSLVSISENSDNVKVLTSEKAVRQAIESNLSLNGVDICNSLIEAIDAFFGKRGLEKLTSNQDIVHQIYLSTNEDFDTKGQIDLNYKTDK